MLAGHWFALDEYVKGLAIGAVLSAGAADGLTAPPAKARQRL
jgi:hypothetical protein